MQMVSDLKEEEKKNMYKPSSDRENRLEVFKKFLSILISKFDE